MATSNPFGEIRQALLEFAYEPETFNVDALVADIIEMARHVEA